MNIENQNNFKPPFIDVLWNIFFSSKSIKIIFSLILVIFIASLYNRYVYIDDAWFGEQSYWFAKCGYPKTPSIKNFFGWDEHLFVYHKLNIIIGAVIVKIFGWSVYYFKIFTLMMYVLFFIHYRKYFLYLRKSFTEQHFLLAAFYIFSIPVMLSLSFTFRPEILITFLGFISYFFLERYFIEEKKLFAVYSALFAGLAFLTHLNGLIFPLAGLVLLIYKKQWRGFIIFGSVASVVSALYFYDLWQPGHFQQFLYQMKSWPDDVSTNYHSSGITGFIKAVFLKLLNEQQRFFWSYRVQTASAIFLFAIIVSFKQLLKNHKSLLIYLVTLTMSLNIFGSHIAERYLIYSFPYFGIIISIAIVQLFQQKKYFFKSILVLLYLLQFIFDGKIFAEIFSKNENIAETSHLILEKIPDKKAIILVPYEYIFNEMESRNLISYKGFEYFQVVNGSFTLNTFLQRAKKLGVKYIVIGKEFILMKDSTFPFLAEGKIPPNPYYEEYFRQKDAVILVEK